MKGTIKAIKRTPHLVTAKVGMSAKSNDAETEDLKRRFNVVQEETAKLVKDAKAYRDGVFSMLNSTNNFASSFLVIFSPIGNESDLSIRYPSALDTIKQINNYQAVAAELKESIQPELDLVDTRILAPIREFSEVLKQVHKSVTKRDHKLIDFDRHNNSYTKLRDKKEKTLKDEQNMYKVEQDYEAALQDYEYHNNLLKTELPRFLELTTAFISPLFHSFYYMQLNILYVTLEKMQGFAGEKFDMSRTDIEGLYQEKLGDAGQHLENLSITKRFVSTAKLMADRRAGSYDNSTAPAASSYRAPPAGGPLKPSASRGSSYTATSPTSTNRLPPMPTAEDTSPPPSYSASSVPGKRPPPPIPSSKPKPAPPPPPAKVFVTALYDYTAQADGDLSFRAGDRIELVKRTDSKEDWWTGRANGHEGAFPANYCQE